MSSSHLKSISFFFFCLCLFIWTSATVADDHNAEANNTMLFSNGPILTMEGASPSFVESLVVKDGVIVFVGTLEQAKTSYPEASSRDLKGKFLLPGFIDPHSHFGMMISAIGQANVAPPPAGSVRNFSDIIVALENYRDEFAIKPGEWIFAWGYDETQLAEGKHITKIELDKAFPNNPVYLQHVSGHMGVANSAALEQGGIDENTRDPIGGRIIRFEDGKTPTGLVQEISMYYFAGKAIEEFQGKKAELFPKAQEHYLSFGVTTAQDGMTDPLSMAFFRSLAEEDKLDFDLVTLHGYASLKNDDLEFRTYKNGLKVQGIKLIGDGSPQGKTAYFTQPYLTPVLGCDKDCVGFPHGSQDELNRLIGLAYEKDIQIFVHGNGDAAIDMVIKAHEEESKRLGQPLDADRRTVVVHSQFVREDQLNKYRDYGMLPSFFTNHAFFWGDVHRENLGDARAFFLSPIRTAHEKGIQFTNHSDEIVTPINPMLGVHSAVNRVARSGAVIGEDERVSPYVALKGVTEHAAYMLFEEDSKGTLGVGKRADMIILDQNPLEVSSETLKDIQVLETFKDGKTVFYRPN